jgi:hypothetical protein
MALVAPIIIILILIIIYGHARIYQGKAMAHVWSCGLTCIVDWSCIHIDMCHGHHCNSACWGFHQPLCSCDDMSFMLPPVRVCMCTHTCTHGKLVHASCVHGLAPPALPRSIPPHPSRRIPSAALPRACASLGRACCAAAWLACDVWCSTGSVPVGALSSPVR